MKKIASCILGLTFSAAAINAHAIPASYGTATHSQPHWQTLADPDNNDQYGVSWSVDNGTTWGRQDLYVGQSVQFRFNMFKPNVGTHYADILGAWLDWGQDGQFDTSDQIAYGEHVIATAQGQVNTLVEDQLGSWEQPDTPSITFFSDTYELTSSQVGDNWLRAQVTCSHSITNAEGAGWSDQWSSAFTANYQSLFAPTGYYYQGETEEWKITVSEVPEPGSIALLGLGLVGLVVTRKRISA